MFKSRLATVTVFLVLFSMRAWPNQPVGSKERQNVPRIDINPHSFDFGTVYQHTTVSKDFSIRNTGARTLEIGNVVATCGCAAAIVDNKLISPGGTARLRVELSTGGTTGVVQRKVLVHSNDASNEVLEVSVRANVVSGGGVRR